MVAGGSGFLGRTLIQWHRRCAHDTIVLSRHREALDGARVVHWDGQQLGDWIGALEGAAALINLCGRSVNCRYHKRNRTQIMSSRLESTRVLGEALQRCSNPPPVWLNSSTATIYKHTYDEAHDEQGTIGSTPEAKDAFSIDVARAWEQEFDAASTLQTRMITLRTAMVFGRQPGSVYQTLRRLARFGLGGKMADGRQYVSWIHEYDFCRALDWLIANAEARGIYNVCAPHPLTNAEMMGAVRRTCGRTIGLPAARWMLEIGAFLLRTETELIIKSRRVIPSRLTSEGFEFKFPVLDQALAQLEGSTACDPAAVTAAG